MKKGLTEMVFILDMSGSMSDVTEDTIGGFNSMINKQKGVDGQALVTTIVFDDVVETVHDRIDIMEVPKLTDKEYCPRGCTALIDAIGRTVEHIKQIHKYIREEDRPEHTIFVITTDGLENASREYTSDKVKKMIKQQEELGWEFMFIGANIDSVEVGETLGIRKERVASYRNDGFGNALKFQVMSNAMMAKRCSGKIEEDWAAELDEDMNR